MNGERERERSYFPSIKILDQGKEGNGGGSSQHCAV